jgi:hypothetical protein
MSTNLMLEDLGIMGLAEEVQLRKMEAEIKAATKAVIGEGDRAALAKKTVTLEAKIDSYDGMVFWSVGFPFPNSFVCAAFAIVSLERAEELRTIIKPDTKCTIVVEVEP